MSDRPVVVNKKARERAARVQTNAAAYRRKSRDIFRGVANGGGNYVARRARASN